MADLMAEIPGATLPVRPAEGEISLFIVVQEELEAAKARLDAKKAKGREGHARKKAKINARRQF